MSRLLEAPLDAVSLFRAVLAAPDDVMPRLVFADWLDDTGQPQNIAWAEYLRLNAPPAVPDPARLDELAPRIKARLTVSAWTFRRHCPLVLALLPADRVTVRLTDFAPSHATVSEVPESVARENVVIPVAEAGGRFIFATPAADASTRERLGFVLRRAVDFVRADADDVQALINATYGQTETETVDALYDWPALLFELEYGTPTSDGLSRIIGHAFSHPWDDIVLSRQPGVTVAEFQTHSRYSEPERQPREVFDMLLEHLLGLPAVAEGDNSLGYHWRVVDVPMISGRTLRWTLICDRMPPDDWYLVRIHEDWNHVAPYHPERLAATGFVVPPVGR